MRVRAAALLLLSVASPMAAAPALAQGTVADYQRAMALRERRRGGHRGSNGKEEKGGGSHSHLRDLLADAVIAYIERRHPTTQAPRDQRGAPGQDLAVNVLADNDTRIEPSARLDSEY